MMGSSEPASPRLELGWFFVLTLAFSWWGNLIAEHSMFPLGPFLAALVVLAATGGRSRLMEFLRRIGQWRVGLRWYALVLLLQPMIVSVAIALTVFAGGAPAPRVPAPELGDLVATALFLFVMVGVGEEPAWRGFALPRLMSRRSTLAAAGLLGLFHLFWHLPLIGVEYDRQNGAPWAVMLMSFSVVTAWLYNRTEGNLLLPALFHTTVNLTARFLFSPAFTGEDLILAWWIMAGLWATVAAVLIVRTGPELGRPEFSSS